MIVHKLLSVCWWDHKSCILGPPDPVFPLCQ